MSAPTTLPIDFVDYLCAEREIARDEALSLLAAHVLELSRAAPAALEGVSTRSQRQSLK